MYFHTWSSCFSLCTRRSAVLRLLRRCHSTHTACLTLLIILHPSYTTHLTPLITLTPPISHHLSHTTHLTLLILHHSSYTTQPTPPILHYSSYTTHLTPLISHHLILHHPSYTTHLTPLILHHSSYTTQPYTTSTHTTHLTPLISHHSSYTTLTPLHLTPPILHHSILHHSSYTTHLTPLNLHHSSYTTHTTSSYTTHLTPLILHHSSGHHCYLLWQAQHSVHLDSDLTWQAHLHTQPHLTQLHLRVVSSGHTTALAGHCLLCVNRHAALCAPGVQISWQRSAQSLPEQLRRAWSPLGRGCRLCGRRSTLCTWSADFVAGAEQLAAGPRVPFVWQAQRLVNLDRGRRSTQSLRTSCGARGRRWASAAFCVAGAALACVEWRFRGRRSTQRLQEEGFVAGAVTEPFGPAAARVVLGRGCLLCGKRSTWHRWSADLCGRHSHSSSNHS